MKQQIILAVLLSCVLLWSLSAMKVEPPKPHYFKAPPQPVRASMIVSCGEQQVICRARKRLEDVKARNP